MKKNRFRKKIAIFLAVMLMVALYFSGFSLINKPIVIATTINANNCSQSSGTCPSCNGQNQNLCLLCPSSQTTTNNACPSTSSSTNNGCVTTSNCLLSNYINPAINLLSGIVVLVVIGSIIMGGIQYSASAGDPQKTAKAKSRIINSILALLVYIFLYAFLQFIIPGGLLSQAK